MGKERPLDPCIPALASCEAAGLGPWHFHQHATSTRLRSAPMHGAFSTGWARNNLTVHPITGQAATSVPWDMISGDGLDLLNGVHERHATGGHR